jgi:hypothetical protein
MQRSIFDPILKEMEEISLTFHEFSFSHNSRNCNKFAHCLARQVSSSHRRRCGLILRHVCMTQSITRPRPADNERQEVTEKYKQ